MDDEQQAPGFHRFEPHAWDKRKPDRPTAGYKALVCAMALLGAAGGTPHQLLELWIRANLKRQWTLVNAIQYLAGAEADAAFVTLPKDFYFLGVTPVALQPACAVARAVIEGGPMTTVDVLRRVQAHAQPFGATPALADEIVKRYVQFVLEQLEHGKAR
ncbi:MAG: hypothetical protein O9256_00720 [Rhizobiaceae bacterium]|nr:hypothetical protein [Rhizobiaceae bacterium]